MLQNRAMCNSSSWIKIHTNNWGSFFKQNKTESGPQNKVLLINIVGKLKWLEESTSPRREYRKAWILMGLGYAFKWCCGQYCLQNRLTLKRPVPTLHKSAKAFTLAKSFTVTRYIGSSRMFKNTNYEWSVVSFLHDQTVMLLLIVFLSYIMVLSFKSEIQSNNLPQTQK